MGKTWNDGLRDTEKRPLPGSLDVPRHARPLIDSDRFRRATNSGKHKNEKGRGTGTTEFPVDLYQDFSLRRVRNLKVRRGEERRKKEGTEKEEEEGWERKVPDFFNP